METELSFVKQPFYYGSYNFWIMSYENRELSYKKGNPNRPLVFLVLCDSWDCTFLPLNFHIFTIKHSPFLSCFNFLYCHLPRHFFWFSTFSLSLYVFLVFFFSLLLLSNAYTIFEIFFTTYLNEELLLINKKN